MKLLSIHGLQTHFRTPQGLARAVDGVSLEVDSGQVVGIVGESGCGKSVLALSILRLLPQPPARFAGGRIMFKGQDILSLSDRQVRELRGNEISMIFQEPMTALNPVFTVGNQLAEVFRTHQGLGAAEAWQRSLEMLERVGVPAPRRRLKEHPYRLSGGMRQRVMIAMALSCQPALLLADEPTTALDVTVQAQILDLMMGLRRDLGTAVILITHDLGVIAETADRVAVMYTGRIMEEADTLELFDHPLHPYTRGLMKAIPSPLFSSREGELYEIEGVVPSLLSLPQGCTFAPRCPRVQAGCRKEQPPLVEIGPGHRVACWLVDHD